MHPHDSSTGRVLNGSEQFVVIAPKLLRRVLQLAVTGRCATAITGPELNAKVTFSPSNSIQVDCANPLNEFTGNLFLASYAMTLPRTRWLQHVDVFTYPSQEKCLVSLIRAFSSFSDPQRILMSLLVWDSVDPSGTRRKLVRYIEPCCPEKYG